MKEYLREIVQRAAPRDAVNIMREYLQARILEGLQESGAWARWRSWEERPCVSCIACRVFGGLAEKSISTGPWLGQW